MKFEKLRLEGLMLASIDLLEDERGFFVERYKRSELEAAGLPTDFAQDNHSRSEARVLRGLHYQFSPAQGKLVGVTRGVIWDVAVDLRPNSVTFGQYCGVELSDRNASLLWMPRGFAHGFCVIGNDAADVLYKATAEYSPHGDRGIAWDDPELAIKWPIKEPRLSSRDRCLPSFADYRANPPYWEQDDI